MDEIIKHLALLCQNYEIHVFCRGNTRTTVVFLYKINLKTLGFEVGNGIFRTFLVFVIGGANYNDDLKMVF